MSEKEILRYHYLNGYPPSKIAKKVRMSEADVKTAIVNSWKELKASRLFPAEDFKVRTGLDYDYQDETWINIESDLIGFF